MSSEKHKIIQAIWKEIKNYEYASRAQRETMEKCYKNYRGIFDEPLERYTRRPKTFVHLTKWHCDAIAAKIKVDLAFLEVLPQNENDIAKAKLMNDIIHFQLRNIDFDEILSQVALELTILGTANVALSWSMKEGYEGIDIELVRELDVFTDPMSRNVDEASSVIIRSIKDIDWVRNNENFDERARKEVKGIKMFSRELMDSSRLLPYQTAGYSRLSIQTQGVSEVQYEYPKVVLYERWGKDWETGEEMVTTIAGQEREDSILLRHEPNPFKKKIRPIVDAFYRKEVGKRYGEGVAERLIPYQEWFNRVINMRIANAESLQNAMWQVKRSANIDIRQLVSRPGGIVLVEEIDRDVSPLRPPDIQQSSYRDENTIRELAQRITGAFDVAIGAPTEPSKTLGAVALEQRGATDLFEFTKKNMRTFLKRLVEKMIEMNIQFIDHQTIIRITGTEDEIAELDEMRGIDRELSRKMGRTRFLRINPSDIKGKFDVRVNIEGAFGMDRQIDFQRTGQILQWAMVDPASKVDRNMVYKDLFLNINKDPDRYMLAEPLPVSQEQGEHQTKVQKKQELQFPQPLSEKEEVGAGVERF